MATSPKRIETLVGFFLFVGVALLGILIMQFGRFADRCLLYTSDAADE